ncbi:Bbp16 family capsid cement protein [uncultured Cohaesibacter sp.]|uniref:Bbp16 family capsid cement protein n=1 Tax=uncultured Cohaesibacter sp. TaxID=1002546 RepID=UPI00292E361E|nr:hypothetical protein [uncultured Cohaesibacter sp.]
MLLDAQALFSDDQAITATAASTNYINFGDVVTPPGAPAALNRDYGGAQNIPLLIQVTEAFDNLTSLTVAVQVDDNPSFSSPTTVVSETVLLANLVAGKKIPPFNIPLETNEQYMRLYYTVTGTAPTAGAITAGIAGGLQTNG